MKNLKKECLNFLALSLAIILVPAIVVTVAIALISLVTVVFSTPDWELIGGIYWIFLFISILLFGTYLSVQIDNYEK